MKLSAFASLVVVCVAALSPLANLAHANSLDAGEGAAAPRDQKLALVDPSSADRSVINGSAKQRTVHLRVADDDPGANKTGDGGDNGRDISKTPERPFPERSTVADIHPALWGAEHNGVEGQTALGPQYRLNDNAELGGMTEKSDVSAMTANPDVDRYTFGLRVTF